ncbi:hypothetical protein YC2023_114627 [Brassica napus]
MDKETLIELSYQRSRASCVGLDVITGEVYGGSKDETFSELEPKLDRGGGAVTVTMGVTVETWLCGFPFPRYYGEEQLLKTEKTCGVIKMKMRCNTGRSMIRKRWLPPQHPARKVFFYGLATCPIRPKRNVCMRWAVYYSSKI